MKFINGNWLMADGIVPGYGWNIFDYDLNEKSMTFYLAERPGMDRHTAVSLPYDTETISSPMEGVIRINLVHFAGQCGKKPCFELNEQDVTPEIRIDKVVKAGGALVPGLSEGDKKTFEGKGTETEEFVFRTGDLELRADHTQPFEMRFYGAGRLLTSTGTRSMGHMTDTKTGKTYMTDELRLNVGDYVYGTGERFTSFIKNGQSIDIWNEDGGSGTWQAYKNIPFYMTNSGYGVFINSPGKVSLEVESQRNFKVGLSVPSEELEYMIIYGGTPKGVIEKYTALTGRPPLVPSWSMGLWLSTSFTTSYDEETVTGIIEEMARREIPLRVFHFDCFWMRENEWCNFKWDERFFPNPKEMLARLKSHGIKICVWINSYIGQKSYLFEEGRKNGYLLKRPDGTVWQNDDWQAGKSIVDFTNPAAVEWYKGKLRELLEMGVDCFKTDFGERIPLDVEYYDHSDPERMHNYYTYLYNKYVYEVIAEVKGEEEAIVFARSATTGGQQFPVHWGGDCFSNYQAMAETLRAGLSLGLCGFGYWSHDIGGFEATSTEDVYKRWVQFGLLSSHSRLHGSGSYRVPWNYGEEACAVLKKFVNLKMSLMPYLYLTAAQARDHGYPMARAMMLEFPDDQNCRTIDRQYMLGENLLVAPIFNDEGIGNYYLPEGTWTHLLSGETREGGRWYTEKYDYFSLPLFAREGSIIPIGADNTKPDYDFEDGVTFRIFPAKGKKTAECRLTRSDKTDGAVFRAEFEDGVIRYCYEPAAGSEAKPFKIQIGDTIVTPDGLSGEIKA